jgi:long-subunit acyl-CoA synthetase (AMP-forming)
MTETTAGCIYQKVGVSPSGSTGVLVSNMECKLVDEEGNGKNWYIICSIWKY